MKVKLAKSLIIKSLPDQSAIIIKNGEIFQIDGIAAMVLLGLRKQQNLDIVCSSISKKMKLNPEQLKDDARQLVGKFVKLKIASAGLE